MGWSGREAQLVGLLFFVQPKGFSKIFWSFVEGFPLKLTEMMGRKILVAPAVHFALAVCLELWGAVVGKWSWQAGCTVEWLLVQVWYSFHGRTV